MKSLFYIISALMLTAALGATADDTRRKGRAKVSDARVAGAMQGLSRAADTVTAPPVDSIRLSGYDKPLNAVCETMLVSNNTCRRLRSMHLTIDYADMDGRQLHSRSETVKTDIPPGQTRMIRLRTWDRQHSYYYHLGKHPRTLNVTPYAISCHIHWVTY